MASAKICKCKVCGKTASEILEYRLLASAEGYETAEEAVMKEEGTYNPRTGKFYCSSCYIKVGMPLGTA